MLCSSVWTQGLEKSGKSLKIFLMTEALVALTRRPPDFSNGCFLLAIKVTAEAGLYSLAHLRLR